MKRLPLSRMTIGVVIGALAGLVPTALVAVGEDSPPNSPPTVTGPAIVQGSTWYSDGTKTKAGKPGTRISAYAVNALENVPYRLVLGLGADDKACEAPAQWINPTVVFAGPSGLIGRVRGTVPIGTLPGIYKLCFQDSSNGNFTGTGGATFIVLDLASTTVPTSAPQTTAPPQTTTPPPTTPGGATTTTTRPGSSTTVTTPPTIPGAGSTVPGATTSTTPPRTSTSVVSTIPVFTIPTGRG